LARTGSSTRWPLPCARSLTATRPENLLATAATKVHAVLCPAS
jgi:hypothetical protein